MIMMTVFLLILNQMEFHLVQNGKENCNHDHIPFNLNGIGNIVSTKKRITSRRFLQYVEAGGRGSGGVRGRGEEGLGVRGQLSRC